jgi:hypothetical protein
VFARGGDLLASFEQQGMIRSFAPADPGAAIAAKARL